MTISDSSVIQEPKAGPYRIQILDRAFQALDVLAEHDTGLGVTELAVKLGLHKSTAHRLVMVLEAHRFLERDPGTGKCRLGSRLMQLGFAALSRLNVYEIARPYLRDLVTKTGETAHMGVLRDGEVVSLINVQSRQTLRTPSTVGGRTPVHCTSQGKAILAHSAPETIETYLKDRVLPGYTANTITSIERLREEFSTVRAQGFAIDNEEQEEGLRCIGAPVWDNSGEVIAAVSIAGPAFRITKELTPTYAAAVTDCAARISSALGHAVARRKV